MRRDIIVQSITDKHVRTLCSLAKALYHMYRQ